MKAKGMNLHFGGEPIAIARRAKRRPGRSPTATARTRRPTWSLFATGRKPNSTGLGLEAAGVKLAADGAIIVNKFFRHRRRLDPRHRRRDQPHQPHAGRHRRSHVARPHALSQRARAPSITRNVATAVFANPNIASVGLSEEERAREPLRRGGYLQDFLSPPQAPSRRAARAHLHEAGGRSHDPSASSARI